jgi:hypothetical protein
MDAEQMTPAVKWKLYAEISLKKAYNGNKLGREHTRKNSSPWHERSATTVNSNQA